MGLLDQVLREVLPLGYEGADYVLEGLGVLHDLASASQDILDGHALQVGLQGIQFLQIALVGDTALGDLSYVLSGEYFSAQSDRDVVAETRMLDHIATVYSSNHCLMYQFVNEVLLVVVESSGTDL